MSYQGSSSRQRLMLKKRNLDFYMTRKILKMFSLPLSIYFAFTDTEFWEVLFSKCFHIIKVFVQQRRN